MDTAKPRAHKDPHCPRNPPPPTHTLRRQSQVATPLPPAASSATAVFNRRIITLYILYGGKPSREPWITVTLTKHGGSAHALGAAPRLLPQGCEPRPAAAIRLPHKLALRRLLPASQREKKTVKHQRLYKLKKKKNGLRFEHQIGCSTGRCCWSYSPLLVT